jgi:hypothetical protein
MVVDVASLFFTLRICAGLRRWQALRRATGLSVCKSQSSIIICSDILDDETRCNALPARSGFMGTGSRRTIGGSSGLHYYHRPLRRLLAVAIVDVADLAEFGALLHWLAGILERFGCSVSWLPPRWGARDVCDLAVAIGASRGSLSTSRTAFMAR